MAKALNRKPTPKVSASKTKPAAKASGKSKSTKSAKKAAEAQFEVGQDVIFKGYAENTPEDEQDFEEGDALVVKAVDKDGDTFLYTVVAAEDSEAYDENPDEVDGGQVLGTEIKKGKPKKVKPEEKPVEVVRVGDMAKLTKKGDHVEQALTLLNDIKKGYFYFGGLLAEVYHKNLNAPEGVTWTKDRAAWEEFCVETFDMKGGRVRGLIDIYMTISAIPDINVKQIEAMGWSKAAEISRYITPDNAEEVIKLANESSITELKTTLKEEYVDEEGNTPSGRGTRNAGRVSKTTFSFALYEDQAKGIQYILETAGKQLGLDDPAAVFEHIANEWATDHLDPAKVKKAQKLNKEAASNLKKQGVELPNRDKAKAAA